MIRVPILVLNIFNSSSKFKAIICEVADKVIPMIKLVKLLKSRINLDIKNPAVKGNKKLNNETKKDSLRLILNSLRLIFNPTKKNKNITAMPARELIIFREFWSNK